MGKHGKRIYTGEWNNDGFLGRIFNFKLLDLKKI